MEKQLNSKIFVENSDGTDDGIIRLINSMRAQGIEFYQTAANPNGLFGASDVVLLQINCQWAERGGTNSDVIAATIDALAAHPDGFTGEIIIADNGQAQFGTDGAGGSLDWKSPNSKNRDVSVMDVVRANQAKGLRVTGVLWDTFTTVQVNDFDAGDTTDGFVVEDEVRATGIRVSYAKFTTEYGTKVSFKNGIWTGDAFDSDALKVINMPVLKSHAMYFVTGAVKGYMGTTTDKLTQTPGQDPFGGGLAHRSIGTGGMGTQMVNTRMAVLNIIDMVWISVEMGPAVSYDPVPEGEMPALFSSPAVEVNKIAASLDPFAMDTWLARNILMPMAEQHGKPTAQMDPAATAAGTFGYWLRLSMNEVLAAGYDVTIDETQITAHISEG